MKYIQYLNQLICAEAARHDDPLVMFGQNIAAGSCLGGLTRNLPTGPVRRVLNTPNVENTMVGAGFGMMMTGVSSIFFMKQQDFLLLGIDQLVNTYNYVRLSDPVASFTIVNIVVDLGYQGIQSSLNNFADFCSIARIPGYAVTNRHDSEKIFGTQLISPGFRIIGVSQRLFHAELIDWTDEPIEVINGGDVFRYGQGSDATIVAFNFSLPQALELRQDLAQRGVSASIFSVSASLPIDWTPIVEDAAHTRRAVLLDDSKSANRPCYALATALYETASCESVVVLARESTDELLRPHPESYTVDAEHVLQALNTKTSAELNWR